MSAAPAQHWRARTYLRGLPLWPLVHLFVFWLVGLALVFLVILPAALALLLLACAAHWRALRCSLLLLFSSFYLLTLDSLFSPEGKPPAGGH